MERGVRSVSAGIRGGRVENVSAGEGERIGQPKPQLGKKEAQTGSKVLGNLKAVRAQNELELIRGRLDASLLLVIRESAPWC